MSNRFPYTCEVCNIKMQKSWLRVVGSRVYCPQCYAAAIREAMNVAQVTSK